MLVVWGSIPSSSSTAFNTFQHVSINFNTFQQISTNFNMTQGTGFVEVMSSNWRTFLVVLGLRKTNNEVATEQTTGYHYQVLQYLGTTSTIPGSTIATLWLPPTSTLLLALLVTDTLLVAIVSSVADLESLRKLIIRSSFYSFITGTGILNS